MADLLGIWVKQVVAIFAPAFGLARQKPAGSCLMVPLLAALGACQPTLSPVVPAGSAAYEAIAVPADVIAPAAYLMRPGDVISIEVFREPDLSHKDIMIDQAGNLTLPLVGQIKAGGKTPGEFAMALESVYGKRYLRYPEVAVLLKSTRGNTVSVEGDVNLPGVFEIVPGQTLLSAIAMARSPTKTAKLDEVLVFRQINGQRAGARFDLTAIRSGSAADPQILPGDVVVVGFSAVRGAYRDILQAAPLLNVFAQF